MSLSSVRRSGTAARISVGATIEGLEDRRMLSAAPVTLKAVTPTKILAGKAGSETVTIRNLTAVSETENVVITLAPSLDGVTAAGAYSTPSVSKTLTIKAHGSAIVKVPFIPPTTLSAGKYHTIATVQLGADTITATAPGTYVLTLPPAPTITPSLVGHYFGLITQTSGGFKHVATFIWQSTDQTLTSLTGVFSVGSQQTTGTMTGSELNTGAIQFSLTSDLINYTIVGKVTPDGSTITGTFKGTLVNNIFPKLNGKFKITRQAN